MLGTSTPCSALLKVMQFLLLLSISHIQFVAANNAAADLDVGYRGAPTSELQQLLQQRASMDSDWTLPLWDRSFDHDGETDSNVYERSDDNTYLVNRGTNNGQHQQASANAHFGSAASNPAHAPPQSAAPINLQPISEYFPFFLVDVGPYEDVNQDIAALEAGSASQRPMQPASKMQPADHTLMASLGGSNAPPKNNNKAATSPKGSKNGASQSPKGQGTKGTTGKGSPQVEAKDQGKHKGHGKNGGAKKQNKGGDKPHSGSGSHAHGQKQKSASSSQTSKSAGSGNDNAAKLAQNKMAVPNQGGARAGPGSGRNAQAQAQSQSSSGGGQSSASSGSSQSQNSNSGNTQSQNSNGGDSQSQSSNSDHRSGKSVISSNNNASSGSSSGQSGNAQSQSGSSGASNGSSASSKGGNSDQSSNSQSGSSSQNDPWSSPHWGQAAGSKAAAANAGVAAGAGAGGNGQKCEVWNGPGYYKLPPCPSGQSTAASSSSTSGSSSQGGSK